MAVFGVAGRESFVPNQAVVLLKPALFPYNMRDVNGFNENSNFLQASFPEGEPLPEAILVTREVVDAATSTCDKSLFDKAVSEALTDSNATIERLSKELGLARASNTEALAKKTAGLTKIGSDMGKQLKDVKNAIRKEFQTDAMLATQNVTILRLESELEESKGKILQLDRKTNSARRPHRKGSG